MKNNINIDSSQLTEKTPFNGKIDLYIRANNFHAGQIFPEKDTFYSAKRTGKNLMRMFKNSLGINSQILNGYTFKYIVIPFENTVLKTTRKKWIAEGIVSPYSDSKVDQQILLALDKINMEDAEKYENQVEQMRLFEEVI